MRVSDLRLRPPITISPLQTSDEAIERMSLNNVRHLLVVDREGIVGLLTAGDLLESVAMLTQAERALLSTDIPTETLLVADLMDARIACAAPETSLTEAARLMLVNRQSGLPVVSDSTPIGIITSTDILELFFSTCWLDRASLQDEPAVHFGARIIQTVQPTDTLQTVCEKFSRKKIHHLPVLDQGRIVGMVSDVELRTAIGRAAPGEWLNTPVKDAMNPNVQTLTSHDTLAVAASIMWRDRLTAVPILDRRGALMVLLTTTDLLRAFAQDAAVHV